MKSFKLISLICLLIILVGCGSSSKVYTVTFKNENNIYKVEVKNGKTIDKITNPTKDGYEFIGWYVGDEPYDFNSEITEDTILVAKWEKIDDVKDIVLEEDTTDIKSNINNDDNGQSNLGDSNQNNNSSTKNTNKQSDNKQVKSQNTTKTIEENETILYSTSTQNEVNMLKGTKQIVQKGENGIKTIAYKVTYDSNGKEISKEKLSENITKQPINEIIKVGVSDYNLNTDVYGFSLGIMCTQNQLVDYGEYKDCTPDEDGILKFYCAIGLKGELYLTHMHDGDSINCLSVMPNISSKIKLEMYDSYQRIRTAVYNGERFYFTAGGGTENFSLTQEVCDTYNLACGRW